MSSANATRLIVEPVPNRGGWNMALDEALLHSAIRDKVRTVRIYRWSEPTVSLGYFQKADAIAENSRLAGLATVRRLSGGGAILHHHEWTYSCAVPAGDAAIRIPGELYRAVHRAIIGVLRDFGVASFVRCDESCVRSDESPASGGRQPTEGARSFLCFSRGDPNDIVLNGHKIVGSAQRRRKGAVLQHGSLLLRASEHAPHLPGIADLNAGFDPPDSLGEQIGRAIASVFGGDVRVGEATPLERERAVRLQREQYEAGSTTPN